MVKRCELAPVQGRGFGHMRLWLVFALGLFRAKLSQCVDSDSLVVINGRLAKQLDRLGARELRSRSDVFALFKDGWMTCVLSFKLDLM